MKLIDLKNIICGILLMLASSSYAQYTPEDEQDSSVENQSDNEPSSFSDRLFYGGNVSFNILNNLLVMDIAPIVGYRVSDNLGVGVGAKYSLIRNMTTRTNWSFYGGSVFSRYKFTPALFFHSEFEALNSYEMNNFGFTTQRAPAFAFFNGFGYQSGGVINIGLMLLYDFIDHPNSPYRGQYLITTNNGRVPLIMRIGVSAGF